MWATVDTSTTDVILSFFQGEDARQVTCDLSGEDNLHADLRLFHQQIVNLHPDLADKRLEAGS